MYNWVHFIIQEGLEANHSRWKSTKRLQMASTLIGYEYLVTLIAQVFKIFKIAQVLAYLYERVHESIERGPKFLRCISNRSLPLTYPLSCNRQTLKKSTHFIYIVNEQFPYTHSFFACEFINWPPLLYSSIWYWSFISVFILRLALGYPYINSFPGIWHIGPS